MQNQLGLSAHGAKLNYSLVYPPTDNGELAIGFLVNIIMKRKGKILRKCIPQSFLHSWVKQRLPFLSSPHYKWKAKNGNLGRILKCHSSANHTFFQVWKIRPSFSKRQLQILIAWLLVVLVIYLKIIFQVSLEWLGFFRLSSVSFGSGLYTKTRNVDIHRYTDNKREKYFSVIFFAIIFKPLKFFYFYLVTGLWLLYPSAFPWFSRALSPIFWGFSDVKHLTHGTWNLALYMFDNM